MTTSKNFDTQVKDLGHTYVRDFDNLIGFTKKTKGRKFVKALKEEYPADVKERIASGKLKVRNLDNDPIRQKPFKNDTFFTVSEIAHYCWKNSEDLHGKFADEKALLAKLKSDETFRHKCNEKMLKKLGKNKDNLGFKRVPKTKIDAFELADYFWKNHKDWFNDLKSVGDLRRMISLDHDQAKKLVSIMKNETKK